MFKKLFPLFLIVIVIFSLTTGCKSSNATTAPMEKKSEMADVYNRSKSADGNVAFDTAPAAKSNDATAISGTSQAIPFSNAILSQRKIIRNANLVVEVDTFDTAYAKLKSLIAAFGYIQESNVKKEKVFIDGNERLITKGTIVIRVDKNKFDSTLSDIKGLGTLTNENIKSDDVTDQFFDTESRLRLLRFEQSRLEDYLKKITDPDVIFKTESRLTDIRHEIESLTVTLNKWNDLVDLSTITLDMSEKTGSSVSVKETSYWKRLGSNFMGSLRGILDFCASVLLVFVQMLPILVFLGVLAIIGWFIYRKVRKK